MDGSAADRISQLPHFILQHIISLLSAACLSKSWLELWLSCPDLTFSFYATDGKNDKLEKFVENTIPRFSKSELSLRSLRIKVRECYNREWTSFLPESIKFAVAKTIEFAVEKHVKILRVHGMGMMMCRLPNTICQTIFTAKSLIELDLRNCNFISIDRNVTMLLLAKKYDKFNNLKRLIFQNVYLDGYWEFEKLFCNIPLIEEIELCDCRLGFEKLRVSNVPKLKRFKMNNMFWGGIILIDAPSLESFEYFGDGTLNIDSCQNLKRLVLTAIKLENLKSFNSFSNFLCLEFLEFWWDIGECMSLNYNISSRSLKHVRIFKSYRWGVETCEVMIDAPNLLLLEYSGPTGFNSISFRNPPKQLKVTLSSVPHVEIGEYRPLPTWLLRVRSSLMKLCNRAKIQLSLQAHDMQKCFVSIKDSGELPEPEVEHLALYCCDPGYVIGDAHRTLDEVMKAVEEYEGACFKLKWSA